MVAAKGVPLMARESDNQTYALTRRTKRYPLPDDWTAYYPNGGGISITMPSGRLGRWFARVNEWSETLISILEKLEQCLYHGSSTPRPPAGPRGYDGSDTPTRIFQMGYLLRKAGHVLLLAAYGVGYLVCGSMYATYQWIRHRPGFR